MPRTNTGHRLAAGIAAVALFLGLAACSAANPQPVTPSSATQQSSSAEASSVQLPDPRTLQGRSTASSVADVEPIPGKHQQKLPATVTDFNKQRVTVSDTSRILALDLYGTIADTVIALGLGDKLVGRTVSNTNKSLSGLPIVTQNGHELNAEAILQLKPSLLLIDSTIGPPEVLEQIRSSGVTVVNFDPDRSIDLMAPGITAVGQALGLPEAAVELNKRVAAELAATQDYLKKLVPQDAAKRPAIAFLYVRGKAGVFFILGAGSGADDLIQQLGGVDVASKVGIKDVKPANSEALAALSPQVFLMMTSGLESTGGIDGLLKRPGVAETPAGAARRVVDMADGQILSFGPNFPAVLRSLAKAIYDPKGLLGTAQG
ncbi:heme/hemin ABC transporter substrate-binding protein [Psychromicrobium lacuslunae]|uniref:Fe/B12 periplasmic-binding domain-containing protein n=1 Tax=Psychromicrobium lacuslunae TaxID=1618207 RepID=A0A0D4BZM6_9MICC|nr:ABC transporter substrate-binding protein [Psychromicrobium lacuslunae]AJT41546.1 hypothetical protein UM93_08530 [Psychromicrobium lacuslunae]